MSGEVADVDRIVDVEERATVLPKLPAPYGSVELGLQETLRINSSISIS